MRRAAAWAKSSPTVESLLLVGSYAAGRARPDSDIDLVIITGDKQAEMAGDFAERCGTVLQKRLEYYGECTSVRVWYAEWPEVEFGFVSPRWIAQPLDAGTRRVLADGYRVIWDKKGHFTPPPLG